VIEMFSRRRAIAFFCLALLANSITKRNHLSVHDPESSLEKDGFKMKSDFAVVCVRVPRPLKAALDEEAAREERSLSNTLVRILRQYVSAPDLAKDVLERQDEQRRKAAR